MKQHCDKNEQLGKENKQKIDNFHNEFKEKVNQGVQNIELAGKDVTDAIEKLKKVDKSALDKTEVRIGELYEKNNNLNKSIDQT